MTETHAQAEGLESQQDTTKPVTMAEAMNMATDMGNLLDSRMVNFGLAMKGARKQVKQSIDDIAKDFELLWGSLQAQQQQLATASDTARASAEAAGKALQVHNDMMDAIKTNHDDHVTALQAMMGKDEEVK